MLHSTLSSHSYYICLFAQQIDQGKFVGENGGVYSGATLENFKGKAF